MGDLLSAGAAKLGIRLQAERRPVTIRPRVWRIIRRAAASRLCLFAGLQMALQLLCGEVCWSNRHSAIP